MLPVLACTPGTARGASRTTRSAAETVFFGPGVMYCLGVCFLIRIVTRCTSWYGAPEETDGCSLGPGPPEAYLGARRRGDAAAPEGRISIFITSEINFGF